MCYSYKKVSVLKILAWVGGGSQGFVKFQMLFKSTDPVIIYFLIWLKKNLANTDKSAFKTLSSWKGLRLSHLKGG